MAVSITVLIWQAKTWEKSIQEVIFFVCWFCIQCHYSIHWFRTQIAVPVPSTRCQSLEIVSGLYSEKWGSKTSLNEWTLQCLRAFSYARPRARLSCLPYIDNNVVRLKYYWLLWLKTTWGLIITIIWHVSTNFTDTILIFCLPLVTAFEPVDYWRKREQNWGFWI